MTKTQVCNDAALSGEAMCCRYRHVGPTAVAPHFQGSQAQAPSPSFAEGTYAALGLESHQNKFAMIPRGHRYRRSGINRLPVR